MVGILPSNKVDSKIKNNAYDKIQSPVKKAGRCSYHRPANKRLFINLVHFIIPSKI
jgi:hypothetical protein